MNKSRCLRLQLRFTLLLGFGLLALAGCSDHGGIGAGPGGGPSTGTAGSTSAPEGETASGGGAVTEGTKVQTIAPAPGDSPVGSK